MPPTPHQITSADDGGVKSAASLLADGRLVAFPTETVYGLGADATNDKAVAAIFAAKDRPSFNPLIVHVPDTASAAAFVSFDHRAEILAERFWPGALSIVAPQLSDSPLSHLVSAGLETAAIRVPSHPVARAILTACRCPVAAPSANRSGQVSPTTAAHVAQSLPGGDDGGPALIVDGGACALGLESTVVDLSTATPTLLRPGGVSLEDLEDALGPIALATSDDHAPKSPGMLSRHYAPATPLRLDAKTAGNNECLLGFGPDAPNAALNLSPTGDTEEAAANLFAMLRTLDAQGHTKIAVSPIPDTDLGRAINDRLRRAAATDGTP
ncbi:MAG: threonylcarbamoyl-AMP synthase [Rhodospirillaceae bacterium]|nr:threonylcarbamoyl-AMP synthase [Rhodospirillaceae bacterium]MBT6885791.1 threonylcarbamoyl-AMP synthase [Rhodospirillaceae bacterium]